MPRNGAKAAKAVKVVEEVVEAEEAVVEEPAVEVDAPKAVKVKKAAKKAPKAEEAEEKESVKSDTESDNSNDFKKARKPRQTPIQKALQLLRSADVDKAVAILEKMVETMEAAKKDKKPRAPSAYNLFVKEKMMELKERSDLDTKGKMKLCSEMWKESKEA